MLKMKVYSTTIGLGHLLDNIKEGNRLNSNFFRLGAREGLMSVLRSMRGIFHNLNLSWIINYNDVNDYATTEE